ncbi:Uncharacterised protein [Klebsiella oxytoca]|nr:Uncharacterised protein [Klebsiella oxytoca]
MLAVNGEGDQAARPPQGHQRQGDNPRCALPGQTGPHAPRLSAVRRHSLPDRRSGPAVRMWRLPGGCARCQRRAEHQAAQRNALQALRQPGRQQRTPAGNAAPLKRAPQAQQIIMGRVSAQLLHSPFPQGRQNGAELLRHPLRRGAGREQRPHRLADAGILRPGAVSHLPQVHRRLPAQGLSDLLEGAKMVIQASAGRLRLIKRQHDAVQRTAAAQLAQGGQAFSIRRR